MKYGVLCFCSKKIEICVGILYCTVFNAKRLLCTSSFCCGFSAYLQQELQGKKTQIERFHIFLSRPLSCRGIVMKSPRGLLLIGRSKHRKKNKVLMSITKKKAADMTGEGRYATHSHASCNVDTNAASIRLAPARYPFGRPAR